ncbi:Myelin regulatory factor, partial [Stegodyphus mimosarum]
MTSPGRGDLGGIDSETFDFSQLEEYINDDSESNIYFHDALVTSSDLKLPDASEKPSPYVRHHSIKDQTTVHIPVEGTEAHGHAVAGICVNQAGVDSSQSPSTTSGSQHQKNYSVRNVRNNAVDIGSSFTKPHHLPDSPPDSGSEPPFSPPNEDPKLRCPSIDLLHQHPRHSHHHSHHHLPDMSVHASVTPEGLKHQYISYGHTLPLKHVPDASISSSTSPTSSSSSPHHIRHHSPVPVSPIPVHSIHSASMPVLAANSSSSLTGQLLTQIPQSLLSPFVGNQLQPQLLTPSGTHLGHLYAGGDEFLYENLSSPVTSTTTNNKKRKLPEPPKQHRNHHNSNGVQVKTEPSVPSPDPTTTVLPSGEEDYNFDLSAAEANALFVDSSYQCIRFQPFQQNTWAQLLDKDMKEISSPNFRVDADKGFNYSNADESFVCQKKNHFQVTVHVQPLAEAHYVRTPEGTKPIEKFSLHFHGVKMESPTQLIKVEQSQSDRSKRPFHPVPLEMVTDQVTKTTVGRLHFSETTSNNMRKKGKPNPDQRFFFLVVSLCAHVTGDVPITVVAHASEKIIVRASNPGQFENDMELSWQKGHTLDSIFHNGRVGINTDRPEESLVVHGNIKVTGHILQPSDLRAKYDICELDTREQLKNVANLRIVRYRYLPEFGEHVGLNQLTDTGVIAQEVQHVIPEAVIETGDVLLKDGQLIEKLLVVNKERIFMENVGAVKELCKVTDNLENRIDELERINRKLSSMKRKDSLKSTATDLSRISSVTSRGKHRCHHTCSKHLSKSHMDSCSSHFIQSTIILLVIIMACCLMALATLYIMEWQSRQNSPFLAPLVIQVKSSPFTNSTSPLPEKYTIFSTLFPTAAHHRSSSLESSKSTTSTLPVSSKMDPTPWESPPQHPVTNPEDFNNPYPGEIDCLPEECPIFCCDLYPDIPHDEDFLSYSNHHDEERSLRNHEEKKSSENQLISDDVKTQALNLGHPSSIKDKSVKDTKKGKSKLLANSSSDSHKPKKRMIGSEEDTVHNR